MKNYRVPIAFVAMSLTSAASAQSFSWKWIKENIVDKIQISGGRTLSFREIKIDGDREAYNSLNNYGFGAKRFSDVGQLDISGRDVGGIATFQARVDTNRFTDPQSQRFLIDVDKKPYRIQLGDVNGSLLNTNRFASFRKSLQGATAEYGSGRFRVKGVYSESKGAPRTVSIQGANSAGPYYLNASQVIRGTEEVLLDGQRMRLGEDYVISYESGSITFISRIVAPTSTIVVTFESLGFNSDRGTIEGAGMTYDFGAAGRIGVTALKQVTGTGSALSTRVELFQGAGAPSTPYFLQFEPLTARPITVKLDGIPQIENVDYRFDPDNPTIFFFLRFISLASTIEVIYTPRPTQTVTGDRETVGLDYRLPIGRRGAVTFATARGKLKNDVSPQEGTAKGVDATYNVGRYRLRGGWRDIPRDFVSVESRGFNRNEKAYDLGLNWDARGMKVEASHQDSDVSVRRTTSSGSTVFSNTLSETSRISFEDTRRTGEPWSIEGIRQRATNTSGETILNGVQARTSRFLGKVPVSLSFSNQFGRGPVTEGTSTETKNLDVKSLRLESNFTDGGAWSFGTKLGFSDLRVGSEKGQGIDQTFNVAYIPYSKLTVAANYIKSDSGSLASIAGFSSAFGAGYNGNGFSGGVVGTPFLTGATDFTQSNLTTTWEANERFSMSATAFRQKYAGSVSSNTETTGFDIQLDVSFGQRARAFLGANRSETKFLGSPQRSDATTLTAGVLWQPAKRWNLDFRANSLMTGGSSDFSQDDLGIQSLTTFTIDARNRLLLDVRYNKTTGYLPQEDQAFEFGHQYRFWQNLSIVTSYKFRDVKNLDGSTAGAYRARGFDIELRFAF